MCYKLQIFPKIIKFDRENKCIALYGPTFKYSNLVNGNDSTCIKTFSFFFLQYKITWQLYIKYERKIKNT